MKNIIFIKGMDMENSYGLMEENIVENIWMIKNMVREHLNGQMVENIKEVGKMENK